ncbi:MAG TPA: helix-turn-helix domain-containing protein, partial [Dissulfurispiraceae bacterium]|nr:helix-turn-helix domain-containing protein [Dissulfurispiraceae bacterium]
MDALSSGIRDLDNLSDSLYIGDNVVWEVESGTLYGVFIENFIRQSFADKEKVIYVSFNKSPQTILSGLADFLEAEHLILVDCFTSGKGKNDQTFVRFYDNLPEHLRVVRIESPKDIEQFTHMLNSIEEGLHKGVRYVFDSLTGMQDLWGNEDDTYKFFTYMCPRLYDLGTVAYWILEKDAHSQKFKANLRHITQVVFDLYKRKEKLYIKAVKLEGRQDREAFKPHLYDLSDGQVTITIQKKEHPADIGSRIRDIRTRLGMSQKELADKVDLTPSFISQLENNQISPSLSSFLQICNALGTSPSQFFELRQLASAPWRLRRDYFSAAPSAVEGGVRFYEIVRDDLLSAWLIVFPPRSEIIRPFLYHKRREFIHLIKGELSVTVGSS